MWNSSAVCWCASQTNQILLGTKERGESGLIAIATAPSVCRAVSMNPSPRGRSLAYHLVQQHQGFIPHVRHLQTDGGEPLKDS